MGLLDSVLKSVRLRRHMDDSSDGPRFFGRDYLVALKKHYPQLVTEQAVSTVDAQ
jgi:hypothetical protein